MTKKVKYDLSKLVEYNVKLPSRYWLKYVNVAGWVAFLAPFAYVALLVVEICIIGIGYPDPLAVHDPTLSGVVACVGLLVTSFVLTNWSTSTYSKHYEQVRRGYVVRRETHDDTYGVKWCIQLYGYTRANQLRTYCCRVEADKWHEYEVGELVEID